MEVTLHDILLLITSRFDEVTDTQKELANNQRQLVDSTNHKIDILRKQGLIAIAAILAIFAPIVIDNWKVLLDRTVDFF